MPLQPARRSGGGRHPGIAVAHSCDRLPEPFTRCLAELQQAACIPHRGKNRFVIFVMEQALLGQRSQLLNGNFTGIPGPTHGRPAENSATHRIDIARPDESASCIVGSLAHFWNRRGDSVLSARRDSPRSRRSRRLDRRAPIRVGRRGPADRREPWCPFALLIEADGRPHAPATLRTDVGFNLAHVTLHLPTAIAASRMPESGWAYAGTPARCRPS
jgi:hypothetical protein